MTGKLEHLLVAIDGSENGNRAAAFACSLAHRHGSELLFCYVIDHVGSLAECTTSNGGNNVLRPVAEELAEIAESLVSKAAQQTADAGLRATTTVLNGPTAETIVTCAKEHTVDAIVMGTKGRRGLERFFLGSTAEGVLRRTEVPTFVVPPGVRVVDPAFDRILVAVDDSDPSDAAVAFALYLAASDAAQLLFCSVAETNDLMNKALTFGYDAAATLEELRTTAVALLAAQTKRAGKAKLAFESIVAEGEPAEQIVATAQAQHADSIVVGTHGRRGLRRLFLGSVAENIVRRSPVPVIVVRASNFQKHDSDSVEMGAAANAMP